MAAPKSWEQYKEECIPIAESKQIQILGWTGQWKGVHTKLDLLCHCGYKWDTTSINSLLISMCSSFQQKMNLATGIYHLLLNL